MPEPEQEETSRDALESAFEEHDESDPTEKTPAPEEETETVELVAEVPTPEGEQAESPDTESVATTDNAPQSWSPAAREEWAKVPPAVKEVVAKREAEIEQVMHESAQARQFGQQFEQAMQPFQQLFTSQGVDAMTGLNELMQTAAPLYGGTPQQKAETIAQLINQFGIDITTLDDLLVGNQAEPLSPEMQGMQEQINSMGQFMQQQQQGQQQQFQQQQTEVNTEVETFVKANEFAGDLRGVMADFMKMAADQGQKLSLPDAYQRAIATRPDIQKVLSDRAAGIHNQAVIGNARQAASSVPQIGGNEEATQPPGTMREAIVDAWQE